MISFPHPQICIYEPSPNRQSSLNLTNYVTNTEPSECSYNKVRHKITSLHYKINKQRLGNLKKIIKVIFFPFPPFIKIHGSCCRVFPGGPKNPRGKATWKKTPLSLSLHMWENKSSRTFQSRRHVERKRALSKLENWEQRNAYHWLLSPCLCFSTIH